MGAALLHSPRPSFKAVWRIKTNRSKSNLLSGFASKVKSGFQMKHPFLLFICGILLSSCHYRLSKLDYYPIDSEIVLEDNFRTMTEHDEFMGDKNWPYVLEINTSDGALHYYGSYHVNDPENFQIEDIKHRWLNFNPTVAVTENRLGIVFGSEDSDIENYSEFALAYILGNRDNIPVYTLEPTWDDEVREMKSQFPIEEITLFYTMRVFLNERRPEMTNSEIEDLAEQLLSKRGSRSGLEGSLNSLQELDNLWQKNFSDLGDWRTIKKFACDPSTNPTRLSAMGNFVNEVRDRHAVKVILDLMKKGNRVFAFAGGSHVVKQEPVLKAALN